MNENVNTDRVRNLLKQLDDNANAKSGNSIKALADEFQIEFDSMIRFRDGDNDALAKSTINVWSQLIGTDSSPYVSSYQDPSEWFNELFGKSADRSAKFDQYDMMLKTRGEVDSAASVWADMVCTGAITEDNRFSGGFLPRLVQTGSVRLEKLLNKIGYHVNNYILPSTVLHQIVRDTVAFGVQYEQLGFGTWRGEPHIVKTIPMPIRQTRLVNPDDAMKMYGYFGNPGDHEPTKWFESYRIAHFANRKSRADEEGVSVFDSSLRSWVQVEAMEGGIITGRLEHAPQRYKWTIDTSGCTTPESRFAEVEKWKEKNKKVRTVDPGRKFQQLKIAPPAGEDLYVGKSNKDSPADVTAIQGDPYRAEIADFDHFFNRLLAGLGPPKHHLGYEADTMRSVGTDLTIVFARKARRVQMQVAKTLNHFYWIELLLAGYDPRELDYVIIPPTLGTRDELVRAQVMLAHATVCRYLSEAFSLSGKVPSPTWFLRYVMGFDDTAIEAMDLQPVLGKSAGIDIKPSQAMTPKDAEGMREKLLENDDVAAEMKWTKYVLGERLLATAPVSYLVENHLISVGDFVPDFSVDDFIRDRKISIKEVLRIDTDDDTKKDKKGKKR